MCIQGLDESLYDHLAHGIELHNSYDGVHEVQAIQYFSEGCRDGTLLKHKLMCSESASLPHLMTNMDKYTTTDYVMRVKVDMASNAVPTHPDILMPAGDGRPRPNNDPHDKQKMDHLDPHYNCRQVVTNKE
ncbi:hypothetical protein ZWY2020_014878 [Hordeum vulgare]|nr:hypothetical protein ZWY2020_014878 [Hordeum vulgare]